MTGKWMEALGNVTSACLLSADNCLLEVSSGLWFILLIPMERMTVCV